VLEIDALDSPVSDKGCDAVYRLQPAVDNLPREAASSFLLLQRKKLHFLQSQKRQTLSHQSILWFENCSDANRFYALAPRSFAIALSGLVSV
jgi:hypothetical protein